MTDTEPEETRIQSYVHRKWFVSTAYRLSSAVESYGSGYYETIVWEWDAETKQTGKRLDCREGGLTHHLDVCRRLAEGRPLEDPEVDE